MDITLDIDDVLHKLAKERPIFCSEADFQHALAWIIHKMNPDADIYPEFPIKFEDVWFHVDIFVRIKNISYVLELKYNTRKIIVQHNQGLFPLKDQSAQDIGRYDFLKDIQRLEQIANSRDNFLGYAIMLTNDSAYWKAPTHSDTIDADFRLHEDRRILHGDLEWGALASNGTKKGREDALCLKSTYSIKWEDYSKVDAERYYEFRYLCINVGII